MGTVASQITSIAIVYSTVYSDADQRKHQSSASLAFVPGIHRGPVNSPHKGPVTRKMFPFDDVIMHRTLHGIYLDLSKLVSAVCPKSLKKNSYWITKNNYISNMYICFTRKSLVITLFLLTSEWHGNVARECNIKAIGLPGFWSRVFVSEDVGQIIYLEDLLGL